MRPTARPNVVATDSNQFVQSASIKLVAAAATLAACVPANARSETVEYSCGDGVSFRAMFHGDRVVLDTATAQYVLRRRGGSLERYGSAKTAFVRDGEVAVLVGAAGGPYEDCSSARSATPTSV